MVQRTIDTASSITYHAAMASGQTNKMAESASPIGQPITREAGLADRVAAHMIERVLDGTLQPGTRLPPERALAEQYGVSRTVIREAVRILVSRGLLETRAGSGTYVRDPGPTSVAESMSLLLRLHHGATAIPYVMVHEVRVVLETEIAGLAARRALPDDIAALEREIARQREAGASADYDTAVSSDTAFHVALAIATHNDLFPILLYSISGMMTDMRRLGFKVPGAYDNVLAHHERILSAVRGRDSASAIRAMRAHLGDAQSILRQGLEMAVTGEQEGR
jgi:GntR family transcriptional repressor for pyruvate dehydrogenase complex